MIEIRNLSKTLQEVKAVSNVTFSLVRGKALAVLGPSGSGKTTLLRLLAGLEEPDEGEIWLEGSLVSQPGKVIPPYQRRIGMVFQRPALWPHMTVARNITFGLAQWNTEKVKARLQTLVARMALHGLESRYPHQLSGGQAQRVALARALAPHPQYLLLDEPLSNLDPDLHASMLALIRQTHIEESVSMILVSHNPVTAAAVCEEVVVLQAGQVVHAGSWESSAMLQVQQKNR